MPRRVNRTLVKLVAVLGIVLFASLLVRMRSQPKDEGRVAVFGTVTYEGQPLEEGIIAFRPAKETKGFAAGGSIRGGKYTIARAEGPSTGSYVVQITTGLPGPRTLLPEKTDKPRSDQNRVFRNIEVVVARKSRLDFHLPPK